MNNNNFFNIFREYMKSMKNPSGEGFYKWVEWNYPQELGMLNKDIIDKYF